MNNFLQLFFKRPPIVFPLISIFLLIITAWDMSSWIGDKRVDAMYWLRPVPLIIYTLFWIGATLLKKWAATAFVIFTIIHLLVFLFWKEQDIIRNLADNFMVSPLPFNIGLCIIILLYYGKMK